MFNSGPGSVTMVAEDGVIGCPDSRQPELTVGRTTEYLHGGLKVVNRAGEIVNRLRRDALLPS